MPCLKLTTRRVLATLAVVVSLLPAPWTYAAPQSSASSTTAWWTKGLPPDLVAAIRATAQGDAQSLQYRRQRAALIANSGSSELPPAQYADVHASWEAPYLPKTPGQLQPPEFIAELLEQHRNIRTASFAADVIESYLRLSTAQELLAHLASNEVQLQNVLGNLRMLQGRETSAALDSLVVKTDRILADVQTSKRLLTAEQAAAQESLNTLLGQSWTLAAPAPSLPTSEKIPTTAHLAATRPDVLLAQAYLREAPATAGCVNDAFDLQDHAGTLRLKQADGCLPVSHPVGSQIAEFNRYAGAIGKEVAAARAEYIQAYALLNSHVTQVSRMVEAVAQGDYLPSDADLQLYRAEVTYAATLRARLAAARLTKMTYGYR